MNCGHCIWFQTYTTLSKNKIDIITKLSCNKKNQHLNDIPKNKKENCSYFKTAKDIEREWKEFGSLIGANL